jgi:hypothetical protein
MRVAVALLAAFLAQVPVAPAYRVLMPVDEAGQQPAFFTFRAHLQAAVARRDVSALMSVVDPDIRTSFGDDNGRQAFEKQWKLANADSEVWDELGTILALGGSFRDETTFMAPYTYGNWPDDLDSFEHVAIVGDRVRVRAAPNEQGSTVGLLSFAIVRVARRGQNQPDRWTSVDLGRGRTGYVASQYVRSPVDYRAIFNRTGETWRMTALVAGD